MVLFRLRSQQTGQMRDFTLLDVLKAFGDTTNDEIRFADGNREDVFNLSSFQDLSGDGSGASLPSPVTPKLVEEALTFLNGQSTVTLGSQPLSLCRIFRNGVKLRQGIDYNKSGETLEFLEPLTASDSHRETLEALYDVVA